MFVRETDCDLLLLMCKSAELFVRKVAWKRVAICLLHLVKCYFHQYRDCVTALTYRKRVTISDTW